MNRRNILKYTAYLAGISSMPITLSSLQSCRPTGRVDWKPFVLTPEEAKSVENIGDCILPSDIEMPGAKEIHCTEFVDLMIRDCLSPEDQEKLIAGLRDIQNDFEKSQNESLSGSISVGMTNYLQNLDRSAFNQGSDPKHSAYRHLKQMILLGYFTSETIMNRHLNYHAIPGEYRGCIDISADEKVYVDNNVAG